jgi:hypothetical protein
MLVANTTAFRRELVGPLFSLRRTFDAGEVNPILNHESVFPFITLPGFKSIDASGILAEKDQAGNPRNVCLMADRGCLLFCQVEPGIYEAHTNFIRIKHGERKGTEGVYTRDACLAAYRWMFTHTDCMVLQGKIPSFNRALKIFAPLLGWQIEFERKGIWPHKSDLVDVHFVSLHYDDWFRKTDDLAETGREFHRRLEEEFVRHGIEHRQHAEELCHDKAVGVCAEMLFNGQIAKGIVLYNRWARFAGYRTIELIVGNQSDVLLLDIGDAVLRLLKDDFKAIICRQPQR